MKYTVEIPQLKSLQDAFQKAPELVAREVMTAGNRALVRYQSTAKELAPVDKGQLRGSIQIRPMTRTGNTIEGSVGTNVKHAIYQEQGTGIYGPNHAPIRPRRARVLAWTSNGKQHFARQVKGTKPKWFMKGSVQRNQTATERDFAQALQNVVQALGGAK